MKEVNMRRLTSFTNILVLIFAAGLFIQACADKPDQGLKSQIDQLKKENAELKSKLAKIEEESAAKTKWDMHLNYPPGNFHSQGAQRFADRVKEATGGALEIAAEMENEMWNLAGEMDQKSRVTLKEKGMTINAVNEAFRKELDEIGVKLRKKLVCKSRSGRPNNLKRL